MPIKPHPLTEEFTCRIVRDMDVLLIEAGLPTGGRMTPEEAESFSVRLWSAAQETRRQQHMLALELANRQATASRVAKKHGKRR
jgi:hypothetical protein